jgi:hypothetical protein
MPKAGTDDSITFSPALLLPGADVDPFEVQRVVRSLREARRVLASRSTTDIVGALTDVVDTWLAPASPWMARAEALLPAATGFSPAMVRYALPTMLEPLVAPALAELVAAEAVGRRGPELILHVLPGNLPGLTAIPAALSLAIGSAALLKVGRGDRAFPPLFVDSVTAHDPGLGACLAARYWPGGERACEDVALAAAELVVAAGADETIADLAARCRGRFIGYGHRISFAVIDRIVAGDPIGRSQVAEALALDTVIWDQRGCLSPQLVFVEGNFDLAQALAEAVAAALRRFVDELPPAHMSGGERLAVRRFRDEAEWRGLSGEPVRLFDIGAEGDGTVVVESPPRFHPTPLARSLRIMPIATCAELAPLLAPVRGVLEAAGVAAVPERDRALCEQLRAWGVHRVCPLGEMQRPPLDWHQGGRPRLADWLA